ncbi:DUF317 domain-containing protein [Streptomyces diacarni]|uniref:DUF317 domain-containing protein n=1 Tax=Streptomyces diacarni TaxID=2800381 RepID=UPI0034081633
MPHRTTVSEDVLVGPRYLAGTTGTDPIAPLLDAAPGWSRALVGPDPYYASSCQRLRAARRDGEWTFTYAYDPLGIPDWSAHFDRTTPDEVLAAFTERLIDGLDTYFADYLSGGPLHTGQTPASVFAEHGWEPARGTQPWRTLAPDEHAAFHIRTGYVDDPDELRHREAATWKITAGPDPVSRPTWAAHFTGHTPQPLMNAAALAVADPEPVARPAHRVPEGHRDLVGLRPTAHSARAAAALARGRFSAATQPTPASPPPPSAAPTPSRTARTR